MLLAHDLTSGTIPETSFDELVGTAIDDGALNSTRYASPCLDKHLQYMSTVTLYITSLASGEWHDNQTVNVYMG